MSADTGALLPAHAATLIAAEDWLRIDVADGAPSRLTLRAYLGDIRQHLAWLGTRAPASIDAQVLKEYRGWLLGQSYAPTTVSRKLAAVRRFYALAHANGALPTNPALGLKGPKDKRQLQVKFLAPAQVQDLLRLPDLTTVAGIRDRALLVLLYAHGLRIAEACGLQVTDVDLAAGTFRVLGKGGKLRTLHLTRKTRRELERWLLVRQSVGVKDEHVFVSLHHGDGAHGPGYGLDVRGARYCVQGYFKRAGITGYPHMLRHSNAVHAVQGGAHLLAVRDELGHTDVQTTQIYARLVAQERDNPARFIEAQL